MSDNKVSLIEGESVSVSLQSFGGESVEITISLEGPELSFHVSGNYVVSRIKEDIRGSGFSQSTQITLHELGDKRFIT